MSHLSVITMLRNKAVMKISKIPLSNDTVYRRISEMSPDVEKNVRGDILCCSNLARQVDESTDGPND